MPAVEEPLPRDSGHTKHNRSESESYDQPEYMTENRERIVDYRSEDIFRTGSVSSSDEGVEVEDYTVLETGFAPYVGVLFGESVLTFGSERFMEQCPVLSDETEGCGAVCLNPDGVPFERDGFHPRKIGVRILPAV